MIFLHRSFDTTILIYYKERLKECLNSSENNKQILVIWQAMFLCYSTLLVTLAAAHGRYNMARIVIYVRKTLSFLFKKPILHLRLLLRL